MSFIITDVCTECDVCLPDCPEEAISEGSPYYINQKLCTDCGNCAHVCPVDCCLPS